MAGGLIQNSFKAKQKQAVAATKFSQEILKDNRQNKPQATVKNVETRPKFSGLAGVLFPGQTVEIHKKKESKLNFSNEFSTPSLASQEKVLFDIQKQIIEKEISQIHADIQALAATAKTIQTEIAQAVINPPIEFNQYQVSFLKRIRLLIEMLRKNILEAGEWASQFSSKKKKKNMFWSKAMDKKRGGQQYMDSSEHSVARSVG